jgi:hypothetical protein
LVFVSLGLGSVVATTVESAPWLAVVGRHRGAVFLGVGGLLALNSWLAVVRPRQQNCAPGEICHVDSPTMRINRVIFWASLAIYLLSVTLTYGAIWWLRFHDSY